MDGPSNRPFDVEVTGAALAVDSPCAAPSVPCNQISSLGTEFYGGSMATWAVIEHRYRWSLYSVTARHRRKRSSRDDTWSRPMVKTLGGNRTGPPALPSTAFEILPTEPRSLLSHRRAQTRSPGGCRPRRGSFLVALGRHSVGHSWPSDGLGRRQQRP